MKKVIFSTIFYIYRAFAHTLLKYKIYYQIVVRVCVLCILGEVLSSFTLHCCGELQSDRSCLTLRKCWGHKSYKPAEHTDCWHQNIVTMWHIKNNKLHKNHIYRKHIRYFQTKTSNIYRRYLSAIYFKPTLQRIHTGTSLYDITL